MRSLPDAIVLCGGAGLRLRSVTGDGPKSMASVAGRPFLELLLRQLRRYGFPHAIMAVGYRKEVIREHFGAEALGVRLTYAEELEPLGTGGAVQNASAFVTSDAALVMNGDSYTDVDLRALVEQYAASGADASMVVVPADGREDCGSVFAEAEGKLTAFSEKGRPAGAPYINAGIYLVSRALLETIPAGQQVSLERELLPRWLKENRKIRAFFARSSCVDIGTPERFQQAQEALATAERNAAEV